MIFGYYFYDITQDEIEIKESVNGFDFKKQSYLGYYEGTEDEIAQGIYKYLISLTRDNNSWLGHFPSRKALNKAIMKILTIKPELVI